MKLIIRLLLLGVLVLGLVVLGTTLFIDSLTKTAIEKSGTYALGVETTLAEARVGLFSGEFGLSGFSVANPEGFQSKSFVALENGDLAVSLGSLASDRVVVSKFELSGVSLDIERGSKGTNYDVILQNLKRFESGEAPQGEQEGPGDKGEPSGKTFLVEEIRIADVTATVSLLPGGGETGRFTVTIPEIVVSDVGDDMSASEIVGLVVRTLLAATIEAGAGILPADLLEDLGGRLEGLGDLAFEAIGNIRADVQGKLDEALGEVGEKLGGELGEVGEKLGGEVEGALEDATEKVGNKLEGLLKKKD